MLENIWFIAAVWMGLALIGSLISIRTGISVAPGLVVISVFLALKMLTKIAGVFPLARLHYMKLREASYTTLLMATGLTFGTISALYGLQNGIIDQKQYTILVSVVILSAFVPTLVAQTFFQPTVEAMHAWGRLYRKRIRVLSVEDLADNGELENGRSSR
jgi:Kef-type K+ transport system membrane component KefB